MSLLDGQFEPNDEVAEVRWLEPLGAARTLSFERDRGVLAALA